MGQINVDEIIAAIEKYRDKYNLIAQADGDGGDTLNKTALYWGARQILNKGSAVGYDLDLTDIATGLEHGRYRRHPDDTMWWSNPNNVTRDQMAPTEAAMALWDMKPRLVDHIILRLPRLLFHFDTQNNGYNVPPLVTKFPDPPTPQELAVIIRGLHWYLLWPLLVILDLALLVSVFMTMTDGQPILNCAVAKRYPTPFGYLAKYFLKRNTTVNAELTAYWSAPEGVIPMANLLIAAKDAL